MPDLARQLREAASQGYFYNHSSLVMEAAAEIVKQRLTIAKLRVALETCEAWMGHWAQHVGHCEGGDKCTCGRTAVLYEAGAALASEQSTSKGGK